MNADYARRQIHQRLENVLDAADNDNILNPNKKDQLTFLRTNEALMLSKITDKFRQELQKSRLTHPEVERAIRLLEYDIQHYAKFLNVDTLFLCNFY